MSKTALFIRQQAQPGKRDEARRIWEKYLKPRAEANPEHESSYYCYDTDNADLIWIFHLYSSEEEAKNFLGGAWYSEYLRELSKVVAASPQISSAALIWEKGAV